MESYDNGEIIGECLAREGVKYLFTLSGAHIMPIYQGCTKNNINIIHFRDERAAVHAAEGYARISRKLGVACITAGVGLTNGITGIASAYSDNIPLLVLAGRHSIIDEEKGGLQEFYGADVCKYFTKWSKCVYSSENMTRFLEEAIRLAVTPTRGPTFLEIPFDILLSERNWQPESYHPMSETQYKIEANIEDVRRALEVLLNAEKPLIVAGDDAYWSFAEEEIQSLARRLMIPVYGTRCGTGVISEETLLSVHRAWRSKVIRESDVILTFGVNFWHGEGYGEPPLWPADAKIIQVDPDPKRIAHNVKPYIFLCGDSKSVARQFLNLIENKEFVQKTNWLRKVNEFRESFKLNNEEEFKRFEMMKPIHPTVVAKYFMEFVKKIDPIVVIDGADCASYVEKWLEFKSTGRLIPINPLGVVGNGIPLGIGAKLAAPNRDVIVTIGDGGFGICGMEIETACRYDIPIMVLILNNSAWGATYSLLKFIYGKDIANIAKTSDNIRYDKIAENLGAKGIYVEDPDKITQALREGYELLKSGNVVVINFEIEREVFGPIYTGRIAPLFYKPRPEKLSISIQYPFKEEHKFLYPGSKISDYHNLKFKPIAEEK